MFSIELSCDAHKYLEKLDTQIATRIKEKLKSSLSENPPSSDSKFIARDSYGDSIFRQRIRDYRALYTIKYNDQQFTQDNEISNNTFPSHFNRFWNI